MKSDTVILDVGGRRFKTTKITLCNAEYFYNLFNDSSPTEEDIFIDRDPGIFKHVLRLLRDSSYAYPEKYISELDYYGVSAQFIKIKQIVYKNMIKTNRNTPVMTIFPCWMAVPASWVTPLML